jgi:hypothetical protein
MSLRATLELCSVVLCLFAFAPTAVGQDVTDAAHDNKIAVTLIAEIAAKEPGGRMQPADRLVPGDEVVYTLEIRNTTAMSRPPPTIDYPVPEHVRYIADSAVGAGAEVTFSVDGGHTYARPENLFVTGADGRKRPATADDYTHIRWQLKHILKGNSVAFARFLAVVN